MSVTWSQNGSGQYLVESKEHLLQIMNTGSLYTDAGTPPADYWASSYLQTVDCDLASDHASILIIGNATTQFTGEYDGGRFDIKNWAHTGSQAQVGLFGYCSGAIIKHVRLAGVWTLLGDNESVYSDTSGFLCGLLSTSSTVYDTEANFDEGTLMDDRSWYRGTVIGEVIGSTIHGLTLRGSVTLGSNTFLCDRLGGVLAYIRDNSSLTQCRNLAIFPNGLSCHFEVGGIVAEIVMATLSNILNAMQGNISGNNCAGGVVGLCRSGAHMDLVVNSMRGNIEDTAGLAGGVIGYTRPDDTISFSRVLNYMKGNVVAYTSGGLVGWLTQSGDGDVSITKSVVAMQGAVQGDDPQSDPQSVSGYNSFTPSQLEVSVDKSFGLTSTGTNYESPTMVEDDAFVYDPAFTDLPYFNLNTTDLDGNTYPWDFVYANIGGKYPDYTHLSVHTAEVSAPYFTDFGLGSDNSQIYLTYANVDTNSVHHDPLLTVVSTTATTIVQLVAAVSNTVTKTDFLFGGGNVYDITDADTEVVAAANNIFDTGDAVAVAVNSASTTTTFVNRGGHIDITGASALLLPFDPDVADVQDATFTLSDATSVDIGFDQPSGQISVNGTMYSDGDYFIMDGKKVTVVDI